MKRTSLEFAAESRKDGGGTFPVQLFGKVLARQFLEQSEDLLCFRGESNFDEAPFRLGQRILPFHLTPRKNDLFPKYGHYIKKAIAEATA
ncbi:MAG TPA: hypothetical protein V6C82_06495 [Chroococcales cyanobacterium]|jgi:hypothetical protein